VIKLRYFKEYTYNEISDHLNMPVGTVKGTVHRARNELYQMLEANSES